MAWRVRLKSMNPVGNGTVDCDCEFYDEPTSRSFVKSFNLQMQSFPSLEAIQAYLSHEITQLDDFDAVMAQFGDFVGKDIV